MRKGKILLGTLWHLLFLEFGIVLMWSLELGVAWFRFAAMGLVLWGWI